MSANKGKFLSREEKSRRENVQRALKTHSTVQECSDEIQNMQHDHGLYVSPKCDVRFAVEEEIVDDTEKDDDFSPTTSVARPTVDWRNGRRIVNFSVLAENLNACTSCGLALRLSSCFGETIHGLGSWLHVVCDNLACNEVNLIPTDKRHGKKKNDMKTLKSTRKNLKVYVLFCHFHLTEL